MAQASGKVKKKTPFLGMRLAAAAVGAAVLTVAAFSLPRRGEGPLVLPDEKIRLGPDSYFHHIYDPDKLLSVSGQADLDLDNFQSQTGTAILFAAFPSMPGNDPSLTMRLAELWAPGSGKADRGLVVFVFFKERRVRAEVGYGLEDLLPDAAMRRLLDETMAVPLREGKPDQAVEAASAALRKMLGHLRPASQTGGGGTLALMRRHVPEFFHKMRLAWRLWLAAETRVRLIMSGIVLLLWGAAVWLVTDIVLALVRLARIVRIRLSGHDPAGELSALLDLSLPVLRVLQAGLIIFGIATGGSYFLSGTGRFGGGGAEIPF